MIRKDLIVIDSDVSSRDQALNLLIDKADALHLLNDRSVYRKALDAREKITSTAIGFDVAIPHGKSDSVTEPFVAFLRAKDEFLWNSQDNTLVKLIFMIGVPMECAGNLHLQVLAELSKKLIDENFRQELIETTNSDHIFDMINDINKKVR